MEKLDSASEEDNSEGKDRSRSGSSDHGKLSVSLVDQISHRMTDWFNVAREKLLGDDYWIPNDPTEVANFPSALLPAHNHILPNKTQKVRDSFFMVVEGRYKNRPDEDWFHVTFTWNESERNDDKRPESPERKPKTLSMFRSTDLQETTDLYESCLHCQDLFLILDKRKDLKRDINALMAKMRSHPLWLAVHIAAGMGTSVYFSKKAEESDSKLKSVLHTASHPEGIYPLQIAIERNHIELVKVLLELGASLSKTDVSGNNALHYGARASSQMLELLGEHTEAPDLLNSLNREGCTPLFVAIRCSNPLCMVTLMRMGAELNITCKGRSPLHETMQQTSGNVKEVIKTLVEVSPGSLTDVDKLTGNTALHVAASKVPLGGLLMAAGSQLDLNVRNHAGQSALHVHTHRTDLGSVLTLAAYGADLNAQDVDGNTPLHIAVSKALKEIVQALLVLGADPNLCNNSNDTPRHLAAKLHNKQRNEFVRCLTMCGAKRCLPGKVGCGSGCADLETRKLLHSSSTAGIATQSSYKDDTSTAETDTEPPEQVVLEFKHKMCLERIRKLLSNHKDGSRPKLIGLLSLDGGGIRGLILIALEAALGDCLWDYFDWTAGTSTGSFVAAGLAKKKSLRECQRIYLRFKDQIFEGWSRPYNTVQLEEFIKNEMGDDTTMADIAYPRVVVTTVLADKHPVRLQLFRNYSLPLDEKQNEMMGFLKPEEQFLWRVLRCSSAAPTYFASVEGKYVDGGVIANNPALDLLSEVQNWNSTLEYLDADSSDKVSLGFVLSVGTGRIPDIPIDNLDFEMTGNPYKVAIAMQNLGFMLIDQVTATEGSPVDRARAWCQSWGVPYFRFSTPMTKDYKLDTRADSEIVSLMWDTQEYINTQHEEIAQFCQLIKMVGPNFNRRDCFDVHKGDVDFSLVD